MIATAVDCIVTSSGTEFNMAEKDIQIKGMKLSFVQVELLAEPLRSWQPSAIPMSFLLSGPLFELQTKQALKGVKPYSVPWGKHHGKFFWLAYLNTNSPSTKDFWHFMVPLGYEYDLPVSGLWPNGAVKLRAFLYPWGIGLVVDCGVTCSLRRDDAVALAQNIRRSPLFRMTPPKGAQTVPLESLINFSLDQIRAAAYGATAKKGGTDRLFSVVTVIDADGGDETQPVPEGKKLHHFLEGLVGWEAKWDTVVLDPLKDSTVKIKKSPPGHVLYAGRRGRAVWFPGNFRSTAGAKPTTLVCYHQNLTMASLQTESLGRLVKDGSALLDGGRALNGFSFAYGDCCRLVAGILGRLYGGKDIYRSNSLRRQIQDYCQDELINVRKSFSPPMSPLTP